MMTFTALTSDGPRIFHQLVHPSGETSARSLIILMMATPLAMRLKGWRGPQWLKRNRRSLGMASFGYALLHTIFYLLDKTSLTTVVDEQPRLYIWTGWVAFIIFVPLALTSMDYVMDFSPGEDILKFDDRLWTGSLMTAQVLSRFGDDSSGAGMIDFGSGSSVTIDGVDRLEQLENSIPIF
jgi:hypothetical protein